MKIKIVPVVEKTTVYSFKKEPIKPIQTILQTTVVTVINEQ
jgi:hypothetical protein